MFVTTLAFILNAVTVIASRGAPGFSRTEKGITFLVTSHWRFDLLLARSLAEASEESFLKLVLLKRLRLTCRFGRPAR
jgi:hypothetical protein